VSRLEQAAHLSALRQDFSRVFRKNLVHPVCAIHPILPDDFANGIRRWLFFCGPQAPLAIFANGNAASAIIGTSRDVTAQPRAGKVVTPPQALAARTLVVGSRKSGLTG
jgi:hypothetical protein